MTKSMVGFLLLVFLSSFGCQKDNSRKVASVDNYLDILPSRSEGFVGEVRFSILEEQEFQAMYGEEWVLMRGQNIEHSLLAKITGRTKLPDMRGNFIRAYGRGSKKVGETQRWNTALPKNPFVVQGVTETAGMHTHKRFQFQKNPHHFNPNNPIRHTWSNNEMMQETKAYRRYNLMGEMEVAPHHEHLFSANVAGGDAETHPKNIAFYAYMKIDRSVSDSK